jgi:hypothetical protein
LGIRKVLPNGTCIDVEDPRIRIEDDWKCRVRMDIRGARVLVGVTFSVIIADEKFPPIGARSISVKIPTPVRYSGASSDSGCSWMFDELRVTDVGQIGERGEV